MPIYVYACPSCGVTVEELRPAAKADDPVPCPICHAPCVRGITNFFVGSGRKAQDTTPRRPAHPPGCPCCAVRRPRPASTPQTSSS